MLLVMLMLLLLLVADWHAGHVVDRKVDISHVADRNVDVDGEVADVVDVLADCCQTVLVHRTLSEQDDDDDVGESE